MAMKLAENIRALRRAKRLTQEQLAEVLGVTVGAVHKWEARLSVPELPLIMELADFFDTSVDALLGYEFKDNRLEATERRLWQYHSDKDPAGLEEVEKALKKYPNACPRTTCTSPIPIARPTRTGAGTSRCVARTGKGPAPRWSARVSPARE